MVPLSVLLSILFIGCSTCSENYGCLYQPKLCDHNKEYCLNDGGFGVCKEYVPQPTYSKDSDSSQQAVPSLSELYDIDSHDIAKRKPDEITKESFNELVGLVKRVQSYLKQNGINFSDLSADDIEELSVVLSYIHDKEVEANQEARNKRLAKLIVRAKAMLIDSGIDVSQLSDQQINAVSNQLAAIFQRSEKKRMSKPAKLATSGSKTDNVNSNVENKHEPITNAAKMDKHSINDGLQSEKIDKEVDSLKENSKKSEVAHKPIVTSQKDAGIIGTNIDENQNKENHKYNLEPSKEVASSSGLKEKENDIKVLDRSNLLNSNHEVSLSEDMNSVKIDKADEKELTYIIIIIVVVVVIILVVIGSFVFCCMKSVERRKKLIGAASEQSDDDYQELCRQHYASRNSEGGSTKEPLLKESVGSVTSQSRVFSPVTQRSRHSRISRNSSVSSWGEEPVTNTLDISTAHAILSYMEDHLHNEDRLNAEWRALCKYEADAVSTKHGDEETSRNRYQRAIPFDHNRVVLKGNNNPMEGDYINASFIIDNDPRSPIYIAAQGPLSHTIHQFWQMVWEQKCVAIVMLSPLVEDGASQCARYWPDEGSCTYNNFEIHLVSEHVWCEDYLVRSLYSKDLSTGETRTLTQFHFLSWPHNGVPLSPKPLLELRRKVSKCTRGNSPVLIHCDDGVGRTGCYILVDLVVQRMLKGQAKEIDVAASLEHLRDQRKGMLTTKEQLEFSLASVADEANAVLKVLLK